MNTYIALFRGINVGGKNTLPMKDLSNLLEELGYKNVQTYIQSGNVVFQSNKESPDKIAKNISASVMERHGFAPKVLLLNSAQLQDAVDHNPFETKEGKALHFFFLDSQPAKPNLEKLTTVKAVSEKFKLHKKVLYLYAPDGIGRSKLVANVESCMGVPVTARNWNTVKKLAEMTEKL